MQPLTLADVAAAREAIGSRLHVTPMFSSAHMTKRAHTRVLLKAETFQRTGSFKPRGAFAKLATLTREQRARGVVTASSGNHAQALAYCAQVTGIRCVAVMWPGASEDKIAAARSYGAAIDLASADAPEAVKRAEGIAAEEGLTVVPAYDDLAVMAGQGTLGLEILDDCPDVDVVLVPVSGGGLLAGIATAVKAKRPKTRIIAVEPLRSPSLAHALAAGRPVATAQDSIADGLLAPAIGQSCLAIATALVDEVVHVSDEEISTAVTWLYRYAKLVAEPAGAATTAALLAGRIRARQHETVVSVVSGGNLGIPLALRLLAADLPSGGPLAPLMSEASTIKHAEPPVSPDEHRY